MNDNKISPEVFEELEDLYNSAYTRIIEIAKNAINGHGFFSIALAGGSTPKAVYELFTTKVLVGQLDVSKWKFFIGDERLVPLNHSDSNYKMIYDIFFKPSNIRDDQIYAIQPSLGDPEHVAEMYERTLRNNLPLNTHNIPVFDLVLLGLGSDGHTASLFPTKSAIFETKKLVVWTEHGTLPPLINRITMTLPLLNAAKNVLFMVTKVDKHSALQAIINGELFGNPPEIPPAGLIHPQGILMWLVDDKAMNG